MRELLAQMGQAHASVAALLADPESAILEIDRRGQRDAAVAFAAHERDRRAARRQPDPWIDKDLGNGMSREEWKGGAEINKILGRPPMGQPGSIAVEGICVRVGAMRCHSQALTIKLRRDLPLADIEALLARGNPWVKSFRTTARPASARCLLLRQRHHDCTDRPIAQARHGPAISERVHRGRPAALGGSRAACGAWRASCSAHRFDGGAAEAAVHGHPD